MTEPKGTGPAPADDQEDAREVKRISWPWPWRTFGGDDPVRFAETCLPLNGPAGERLDVPAHVASGLVLAAASAGLLTNATELMRWTRVLDSDAFALQRLLRDVFPLAAAREVGLIIDRVPGAMYSGGMFHRLHYGHDLGGLIAVTQRHGWEYAAGWANHVFLRDFWTPHGVPWLPFGSGSMLELLTQWGVKPTVAASLLSVNAATFGGMLLGLGATTLARRALVRALVRVRVEREVAAMVEAADAADVEQACTRAQRVLFSWPTELGFHDRFAMASALVRGARAQDDAGLRIQAGHLALDLLREALARHEPTATVRPWANAPVSFAGLTGLVYAQAYPLAFADDRPDLAARSALRSTVRRALERADALNRDGGALRPRRPLSAAVNYLVALDTTLAYPDVVATAGTLSPIDIRSKLGATLETVGEGARSYADQVLERLAMRYPLGEGSPASRIEV